MAKYRITAEVTIEGPEIKKEEDAIREMQVLLGCYDDMSDTDTDIRILPLAFLKE